MNIYAVIIGSEILNRRRTDAHFEFLSNALGEVGHTLFASLVIKDDERLITDIFEMVKRDDEAIMFCFGGIGSTPDDLTRQLASNVFSDGTLHEHPTFAQAIKTRLGERAYPHPIKMSHLAKEAELLYNPVNNMSGFRLFNRYFFMPGFPEMSHPMCMEIIDNYLPKAKALFTKSFLAKIGEARFIDLMDSVPNSIEVSSLPMIKEGQPNCEIMLRGHDAKEVEIEFAKFLQFLEAERIEYELLHS